jgi:hypothetical protein
MLRPNGLLGPDLPTTLEDMRDLVIAQRRIYGDALMKLAVLARNKGATDLAAAADAMRETLGLSERTTARPLRPGPVETVRGSTIAADLEEQYQRRIVAALERSRRQLSTRDLARTIFELGEVRQMSIFDQALRTLRQRNLVDLHGHGTGTTYTLAPSHSQAGRE